MIYEFAFWKGAPFKDNTMDANNRRGEAGCQAGDEGGGSHDSTSLTGWADGSARRIGRATFD